MKNCFTNYSISWFSYFAAVDQVRQHRGGLKTLVLDMLRPQRHPTHFSTEEAVSAAEKIAARQTLFIHMTHDISHAGLELPAGMALAHDGLALS